MKTTKHFYGLLAALAATTTFGLLPAMAADTSDTTTSTAPTYIDITINHVAESTGIEMGDGARARGTGSIATGKNSVAVGKNAVATGGNENKDTITQKLNENKEKLATHDEPDGPYEGTQYGQRPEYGVFPRRTDRYGPEQSAPSGSRNLESPGTAAARPDTSGEISISGKRGGLSASAFR